MKRLVKVAVLLSVMAVAALSCVNDNITEPVGEELLEMLPSVEEQVSMMEASLSDIVELEKAARPHGLVLACGGAEGRSDYGKGSLGDAGCPEEAG